MKVIIVGAAAMQDAAELAKLLGSGNLAADADRVAARITARGKKAVLESRRAKQAPFETSPRS